MKSIQRLSMNVTVAAMLLGLGGCVVVGAGIGAVAGSGTGIGAVGGAVIGGVIGYGVSN